MMKEIYRDDCLRLLDQMTEETLRNAYWPLLELLVEQNTGVKLELPAEGRDCHDVTRLPSDDHAVH